MHKDDPLGLSARRARDGPRGGCVRRARAPADGNCRCKKRIDRLERNTVRHFAVVTALLFAWLAPSSADAQRVVAETFMMPALDPGIQLHVRNKHLEGRESFPSERVALFVHGATYPSETGFDIDLPGGRITSLARATTSISWMCAAMAAPRARRRWTRLQRRVRRLRRRSTR